jgi:peptidoglycan/LPS O-acetylase OafA/YrhL
LPVAEREIEIHQPNPDKPPTRTSYYPFVEGLRAVCALYVVLHHAWVDTWNIFQGAQPGTALRLFTGWLAFGHEAVTVFIAISGFCLTLPVIHTGMKLKSTKRFFRRRAIRILPPYYAALVGSVLVIFAIGHPEWVTLKSFLQHALLIHDFGHHMYEINGPMWSVAVEFHIYLLFPLLLFITRRWSIYTAMIVTAVPGFVLYENFGVGPNFERDFHYVFVFTLGMYAACVASKGSSRAVRAANIAGLLCAALTIYLLWLWSIGNAGVIDFLVGVIGCCVLISGCASPRARVSRVLSKKPLLSIGAFSYSLYLVHKPVQFLLNAALEHWTLRATTAFAIRASVGTLLALAVAYGFYLLFEKPILERSAKGSLVVKHGEPQAA